MRHAPQHCVSCGKKADSSLAYRCLSCGGVIEVEIPLTRQDWDAVDTTGADSMWIYSSRLPVPPDAPRVTLGEGGTPLVEADPSLAQSGFAGHLLLKDETTNPTGSFKDRLISVAVTRALADGYTGIVCASTGNAGASAAAYASRAGVPCVVCVPASAPESKLRRIQAHGVVFVAVHGNYSAAWTLADELQRSGGFANVTTTYQNPYGVAALRTVAYELIDAMQGRVPEAIFVPTGSGPLVRGVLWGYEEARSLGIIDQLPKMVAVQAEGCAPIVLAFERGDRFVLPWGEPATAADGIADPLQGYPQDGSYTLEMLRRSNGWAISASDAELWEAANDLAREAGLFAELSGAAGLAGLRASLRDGRLSPKGTAVVLVTGSGSKDLDARPSAAAIRFDFDPSADDLAVLIEDIVAASQADAEEH